MSDQTTCKECLGVIPGTFIVCGEGDNYCSQECLHDARVRNKGHQSDVQLKQLQVVIVDGIPEDLKDVYPFVNGESLLFLGEIPNMKGHVVVADHNGKVHWGYHDDWFRNPTDDEL